MSGRPPRVAYAPLSEPEYAIVFAHAQRDGLTIANYVRRCINAVLIDEGDDVLLLEERPNGKGRRPRPPEAPGVRA